LKLEARFFLDLAEKNQDNRKAFGYLISVFFAAAARRIRKRKD
jgi:hypothetical protein